jgi:hypothetical protein
MTVLPCGNGWTTTSSFTAATNLGCPIRDRCDLEHRGRETVARARWRGWPVRHGPFWALGARDRHIGIETADMLVQEVLSRNLRDRRAVARYSGLTGSPDESGSKRREKGLSRSGNARVRRGTMQLAWRFVQHQTDSALARWFNARTENARGSRNCVPPKNPKSAHIRPP